MALLKSLIFILILSPVLAMADEPIRKNVSSFYPEVVINVPLFIGVGGGYSINEHFQTDLLYGVTPQPFYSLIGKVAAELGGNDHYQDVIESAFQNNSLLRLSGTYHRTSRTVGWHFTAAYSSLSASGDADINDISQATSGNDYSNLRALLIAAGRDTNIHIDSTLQILELEASHSWAFEKNWVVSVSGGLLKVLSSDIHLKSGFPNFEATPQGNRLMRSSENDIEGIIDDYGLSPTAGVQVKYLF